MKQEEFQILLSLFIMFTAAKIVGEVFLRLKQPAVIGELLAGAVVGAGAGGYGHNGPRLAGRHPDNIPLADQ